MATSAAYIELDEGAAPSTPATGKVRLYAKTDGSAYQKDDAGTETGLANAAGGDVATDAIWDTKGDLAVATAANTAQKLAAGANGTMLIAASGETTGLLWNAPAFATYTRTAGNYTTNSTSFVDMDGTNLSFTITTLARRVKVCCVGSLTTPAVANSFVYLDVDIDGSRAGGTNGLVVVRNANDTTQRAYNASFEYLTDVLTAGSHTFKFQWKVSAGTGVFNGDSTNIVSRFWVEETLLTT